MTKLFFLIIYIFSTSLFANIEFDAKKISYHGKKINLEENVKIRNELGTISCSHATIMTEGSLKNIQKIELHNNIQLELKNKCNITTQKGEVDIKNRNAILISEKIDDPIVCIFKKKIANGYSIPIIKCQKLLIDFDEDFEIKKIKTHEDIIIEDSHYTIYGNEGEFDAQGNVIISLGKIHFFDNKILKNACIKSSKIALNVVDKKIYLFNAEGSFLDQNSQQIIVKADTIIYHEIDGKLEFLKNIEIIHPTLNLANDTIITVDLKNGVIQKIDFLGNTAINYAQEGQNYSLISDGNMVLDTSKMHLFAKKQQQQISLEDAIGKIYGDSLIIEYNKKHNKFKPKKIILEDNIRMINGFKENKVGVPIKYALADKMELCCESKKFDLTSKNTKFVLFYDPINNIKISAHGITFENGKFTGKGNVRFHFLSKELEEIRNKFTL